MFDAYTEEEITDEDIEDRFREFLDETYGEFSVGGITFSASLILEELDPIAFNSESNDYESMLRESGEIIDELPEEEEEDEDEEDDE